MSAEVIAAIEDMAHQLAGEELRAAITVTIDFCGQPMMWVSGPSAHSYKATDVKEMADAPPDRDLGYVPLTINEASRAVRYLLWLVDDMGRSYKPLAMSDAHHAAIERQLRLDERDARAMFERESHANRFPFRCVCGRDFASQRGLGMHISRTRWGTHEVAP